MTKFNEGDKVRIELVGEIVDGKLVLDGELELESLEPVTPTPEPEPEPEPPTVLPPEVTSVVSPTNYQEVDGAVRGFEYVAPWYQRSRWYLFSSIKREMPSGGKWKALVVKDSSTGRIQEYPYNVVHCSIASYEDGTLLYTIEEENDEYRRYIYDVKLTASNTVSLTKSPYAPAVSGDVACITKDDDVLQKTDRFNTTHYRAWTLNDNELDTNLDSRHQIYTLTMLRHEDVLVGLAGIFRIEEQNGRQQIGPIYPVWCYIKDNKVHYPMGIDKAFGRDDINPERMLTPGGTIVEWGKQLRFCLTYNGFAHTKWAPGSTQNSYLMTVDKDKLMESMGL